MEQSHKLTIMAVALNEARHVARLQDSVNRLRRPAGIEIETILIDGGSNDETVTAARTAGFTKVVELPGANIPVCRNAGASEARGDWLAFVDADCELAEDWLEQAVPLLADADRIILAWPARPPEPMTWVQAAWLFHWLNKNGKMEMWNGRDVVRDQGFRLATTRNMIFTRAVFDAVNGFNEELPTGEDSDFAFRAYMAGIPVLGLPSLRVFHHGEPRTLREFYRQQIWHANRRSYEHIKRISGGKVGGNAPLFSALFLGCVVLAAAGIASAIAVRNPLPLVFAMPLIGLNAGPAFLICSRGESFGHFFALAAIYFVYGWARMLDLIGMASTKTNWKFDDSK